MYLITGGAGFIGSHLVQELIRYQQEVRVFDNFSSGRKQNLDGVVDRIELIEGDIRDLAEVRRAMKGIRYVLHQAAICSVPRSVEDPASTNEVNAQGTLNVLLAAREAGVQRVVYASSSSVYGESHLKIQEEDQRPFPISPYAVSKLAGELYCRLFSRLYGLETVSLRYFNVFGPRQDPESEYAAVVPRFMTMLLARKRPTVFGDGKQTRDFTHVENVVEANLAACAAPKAPGETVNIACGDRVTIAGLAYMIGEIAGWTCEPKLKAARSGDVRHSLADITRAQDVIGYRVRVNLQEGLERTIACYRDRKRKVRSN